MNRTIAAFRPSRSKGQCFLTDAGVIGHIVETIAPTPGETLLEIGAGAGQLTVPLLASPAAPRVIAIEADPRLAAKFPSHEKLVLIRADALKLDFAALLDERGLDAIRVVGNLPYSIAAPILLRLLSASTRLRSLTLMFQKEVATRLTARPGTKEYSSLSVLAQQAARVELLFRIPPTAFKPRPRVTSSLVGFSLLHDEAPEIGNEDTFRAVVRALLAHRRKTIANNIKHLASPNLASGILEAVSETSIDTARRAETLSVEEFAEISRICALQA